MVLSSFVVRLLWLCALLSCKLWCTVDLLTGAAVHAFALRVVQGKRTNKERNAAKKARNEPQPPAPKPEDYTGAPAERGHDFGVSSPQEELRAVPVKRPCDVPEPRWEELPDPLALWGGVPSDLLASDDELANDDHEDEDLLRSGDEDLLRSGDVEPAINRVTQQAAPSERERGKSGRGNAAGLLNAPCGGTSTIVLPPDAPCGTSPPTPPAIVLPPEGHDHAGLGVPATKANDEGHDHAGLGVPATKANDEGHDHAGLGAPVPTPATSLGTSGRGALSSSDGGGDVGEHPGEELSSSDGDAVFLGSNGPNEDCSGDAARGTVRVPGVLVPPFSSVKNGLGEYGLGEQSDGASSVLSVRAESSTSSEHSKTPPPKSVDKNKTRLVRQPTYSSAITQDLARGHFLLLGGDASLVGAPEVHGDRLEGGAALVNGPLNEQLRQASAVLLQLVSPPRMGTLVLVFSDGFAVVVQTPFGPGDAIVRMWAMLTLSEEKMREFVSCPKSEQAAEDSAGPPGGASSPAHDPRRAMNFVEWFVSKEAVMPPSLSASRDEGGSSYSFPGGWKNALAKMDWGAGVHKHGASIVRSEALHMLRFFSKGTPPQGGNFFPPFRTTAGGEEQLHQVQWLLGRGTIVLPANPATRYEREMRSGHRPTAAPTDAAVRFSWPPNPMAPVMLGCRTLMSDREAEHIQLGKKITDSWNLARYAGWILDAVGAFGKEEDEKLQIGPILAFPIAGSTWRERENWLFVPLTRKTAADPDEDLVREDLGLGSTALEGFWLREVGENIEDDIWAGRVVVEKVYGMEAMFALMNRLPSSDAEDSDSSEESDWESEVWNFLKPIIHSFVFVCPSNKVQYVPVTVHSAV